MKHIFTFFILLCSAATGEAQLHITNGGSIYLKGNAILSLNNTSLVNNGAFTAEPEGKIVFNGNATNQISGNHDPDLDILEIAKTGTGKLQLQTRIMVSNKVVFTSGLIDLGNYDIDLGLTGLLVGENEHSRITGAGSGEVMIVTSLEAPAAANPGNLGLHITSSKFIGLTAIKRGHKSLINVSGGYGISRYYVVDPINNEGLNATLRFHYFDAEKNSLDENTFSLWQHGGDTAPWTEHGYSARNPTLNYVEKTGLDSLWKRWTLSPAGALPVTGMALTGIWKNNNGHLKWTTIAEYNNSHFLVQRKYSDDVTFVSVGRKNSFSVNGNSNSTTAYTWVDAADEDRGPIEYRVQQVDRDGRSSNSNIIIIKPAANRSFIVNTFPTISVKNQIYIQTGNLNLANMQVSVYDMKGSLVLNKMVHYGSQWLSLPVLNAGNYKMLIRSGDHAWMGGFVK